MRLYFIIIFVLDSNYLNSKYIEQEESIHMQFSFHYMIMAEHSIFQKELLYRLKGTGLTIGQPKILDYLQEHDGSSQKEIARGCHIEPGTLTSLLNRMEKNGLVERRMLEGNRRSIYIYLTDHGKAQAQLVKQAFAEMEKDAFYGIEDEDRSQFLELFSQIHQNISEHFYQKKEE